MREESQLVEVGLAELAQKLVSSPYLRYVIYRYIRRLQLFS